MSESTTPPGIITAEQLRFLGYESDGNAKRCLQKQGIVVFDSPKGPWTTLDLVNAAGRVKMGLPAETPQPPQEKKTWLV